MLDHAYAVILAGGSGERFWPLSTAQRPKQFISLFGGMPLLQLAVERLHGLIPPERVLIITAEHLVEASRDCAFDVPPRNIIGEPCKRDTAAACALAAALVAQRDPDGVFCILTADHLMSDLDVFQQTLSDCLREAKDHDILVTIGMRPSLPATGFGYIQAQDPWPSDTGTAFFTAHRFVEKPDELTASRYLADGNYYWNGGMFVWNVRVFERALRTFCPALHAIYTTVVDTPEEAVPDQLARIYPSLEPISIDYALMEKADNIVMARGDFGWDDVGAWPAVAGHFNPDVEGNILIGSCETIASSNNIVVSENRLTALIGVSNLVVVQSDNAILVCPRDRAQEVKKLVARIARRPDADKYL